MAKRFTLKDVANSKVAKLNEKVFIKERAISGPLSALRKLKTTPKSKRELNELIENWCVENNFLLEKELVFNQIFDTKRQFRFDWAIPKLKLGIEYDGIMSNKSGHTTIDGFMKDCTKLNIVTANGWSFFRYHTRNYKLFSSDIEQYKKLK